MYERTYTIGEVSKITGVPKDTLRFYDKIELLQPNVVDPINNYRYYTFDQFWKVDIIGCCRKLNISIEKIKIILQSQNNHNVVALMKEHQKEVLHLRAYFEQVLKDIDWYMQQHNQICETAMQTGVVIKNFQEKRVIYGHNTENTKAYHLKLQEFSREAIKYDSSIRRNYGFILEPMQMENNMFLKQGEYIALDNAVHKYIDEKHFITLPAGEYACCMVNVFNDQADFSALNTWLAEQNIIPTFVLADEIGLQLFEYLDHGYLCEVKVLLHNL